MAELYSAVRKWRDRELGPPADLEARSYVGMADLGPHPAPDMLEAYVRAAQRGDDLQGLDACVNLGYPANEFESRYRGYHATPEAFAQAYVDRYRILDRWSSLAKHYFDFQKLGHDLLRSEYASANGHYFWAGPLPEAPHGASYTDGRAFSYT